MRINGYSFKYVCVKCCLKICFYCLTFSTMSNMNSADFTTPNSHHRFQFFKKRCCLSSKIRRILTWWDLIDAFWIRLRIVKDRFVKYRFVRYTFRFVRYRFPRVSILLVSIMSSRRLPDMSSRHLQDMSSRRVQDMPSRRLQDAFSVTNFHLPRRLQDVLQNVFKTSSRHLGRRKIVMLKMCWRCVEDVFKTSSRPTNVCWVPVPEILFE